MKYLVTGASGFIGNSLVHRLCRKNHQVIGLLHNQDPSNKNPNATYIIDDIVNPGDQLKNISKTVDVIFHCAAFVKDYGPKQKFYDINVLGTKNLVELSKDHIKRFIFLSHIPYEKVTSSNYYNKTKTMAESYLINSYETKNFPVVIIRPGNVYGPGATTWVLRPLESIKKNKIALIDQGSGLFLHTYIDNLLDALISAAYKENIDGSSIDITDGDYTITWGQYLNDIASMINKDPIQKNLSKSTALIIAKVMMGLYKVFKIDPWVTPQAVETFTNTKKISIKKAEDLLDYSPKISYREGMKQVKIWLKTNNYIDS